MTQPTTKRLVTEAALATYVTDHAPTPASASTTAQGIVELATNTEATTGTDTVRAVTPAGVKAAIDALIAGAPGALDTLNEIAAQLTADESAAGALTTTVAGKQALQKVAATVSANGTAVANKHNPVDATAAVRTITLPTGQAEGTQISVEKTDASTNGVAITGSIRGVGSTTITLTYQSESLMLRADSAGSWWPIAGHRTKVSLDAAYVPKTAVSIAAGTTQAAMDAAIAAVASTGGTVIFPPGDYTGTINLTANKPISLLGYGATIKAQTTGAELIKFHQGDGNTIMAASARGFILDGNGQTGVVGLSYEDTDGATSADLFIKNCSIGVLFHTVASGKWVERCALSDTFITGCTTGIEFRKEAAAMPSFNEVALNNVGVSQSSSIGIKQGAGCDFTRVTWDNVTVWCPDNAIGVEFAGRLDFARLQFGVESLGAGTGAKAIHVATTYTNYADPYAHHIEASIVGSFLGGRIVDDSTGGFGIVVRDGQNVISTGLGPAMFAYHNGDAFPKVKIGVAGIEFGPGNAATTSIVQSFYADYFKSFGHLLFQADPGFPNAAANGGSASKAIHVYGTDDTYAGYVPVYATSDGPSVVPSNTQTGTTYTLVAADAGKAVTCNNAAAITLTVPPNSSVAYTIGTVISVEQLGAGQVTITPGAGVTINSRGALTKTAGQYGAASLRKIATDTWLLAGDLA